MEYGFDGSIRIAPVAPADFWQEGFGQTLSLRNGRLDYMMKKGLVEGSYEGDSAQTVLLKLPRSNKKIKARVNGKAVQLKAEGDWIQLVLPAAENGRVAIFSIRM